VGGWLKTTLIGALLATAAAYAVVAQERPAGFAADGYLGGAVPDAGVFIPPPPALGSPADVVDISAYERTRSLQGGRRWEMAAKDAVISPAMVLEDFSCALGVKLDPANAPKLLGLMSRMGRDVGASVEGGKAKYRRPRPFVRIPGPICYGKPEEIGRSWSYPSGHSTWGWSAALILAEIVPERASQILARGRAYGESRVVCGVHYVSDVEAGRTNGAGLVAALHTSPAFQADVAAARAEIAALRRSTPAPEAAQCAALDAASSSTPW